MYQMNIYQEIKDLGVKIDHHESDLYVPVTTETTKLINKYEFKNNVKSFVCNIDKKTWYDIPFAYSPFWDNKQQRS
jgi:hypothetical protein